MPADKDVYNLEERAGFVGVNILLHAMHAITIIIIIIIIIIIVVVVVIIIIKNWIIGHQKSRVVSHIPCTTNMVSICMILWGIFMFIVVYFSVFWWCF